MSMTAVDGCLLSSLAPEIVLFSVVSYLDGKGLGSLCEALLASKNQHAFAATLIRHAMEQRQEAAMDCAHAVGFVHEFMQPRFEACSSSITCASTMRHVSEWCLLWDYLCVVLRQRPRGTASVSRLFCQETDRMGPLLWPVGVGVFAVNTGRQPLQTKVIVHSPRWDPVAMEICSDIFRKNNKPQYFAWLPSEGDLDGFLPDENIGFIAPFDDNNQRTFCATQALTRNDDFLPAMGRAASSSLTILPALDCPIYGPLLQHMLTSSATMQFLGNGSSSANRDSNSIPMMMGFFTSDLKTRTAVDRGDVPLMDRIKRLMEALDHER
ncbi:expressed unknown protein [Seminavis robusta]|uniref:Uncharacterized protein n=1 Tax=Seminavis robusta TaxID=568900 RepID=A0A9N8DKA5_9STRA|nr:expressed unknown protein [Seminavis robusta]|eukprot:Sro175_g076900.1 n/a (324) ;mRNA; r:11154-12125